MKTTVKEKLFGLYPEYVISYKGYSMNILFPSGKVEHKELPDYLSLRSIDDMSDDEKNKWWDVEEDLEYDLLRAIGVATPFGYMENNEFKVMSIEEQIKNGLVVLKEVK